MHNCLIDYEDAGINEYSILCSVYSWSHPIGATVLGPPETPAEHLQIRCRALRCDGIEIALLPYLGTEFEQSPWDG